MIKPEEVRKKMPELSPSKSPGPGNLYPRPLKEMSAVLDKSLAMLYQKTLKTGRIPSDWKLAEVTAIFKKGKEGSYIITDH